MQPVNVHLGGEAGSRQVRGSLQHCDPSGSGKHIRETQTCKSGTANHHCSCSSAWRHRAPVAPEAVRLHVIPVQRPKAGVPQTGKRLLVCIEQSTEEQPSVCHFHRRVMRPPLALQVLERSSAYPTAVDICTVTNAPERLTHVLQSWKLPASLICGTRRKLPWKEPFAQHTAKHLGRFGCQCVHSSAMRRRRCAHLHAHWACSLDAPQSNVRCASTAGIVTLLMAI